MDKADIKRLAESHGLTKLTPKHLEQFEATINNGERLVAQLPKDLHWTEEPAHTFKLAPTSSSIPPKGDGA